LSVLVRVLIIVAHTKELKKKCNENSETGVLLQQATKLEKLGENRMSEKSYLAVTSSLSKAAAIIIPP
jgi:hypothetical protein